MTEVAYCLDSALDAGDITGDIHAFLMFYHPDPAAWLDGIAGRTHHDWFASFRYAARTELASWRAAAAMDLRAAMTWQGLHALRIGFKDAGRGTLSEAVRLAGAKGRLDKGLPEKLLLDPSFVLANATPFMPAIREIAMRAEDDIRIMGLDAFRKTKHLLREMSEEQRRRRIEMIHQELAYHRPTENLSRKERKARRKPLLRSLDFLAGIVGRQTTKAFVSGDRITVEGYDFNFRVRCGVLSSNGHGALDISVTDKDHIELVDLCFYFKDMPAPDQMAALIMHVQAGNEQEIIRTGNVFRSTDAAATNAAFMAIRDQRDRQAMAQAQGERDEDDVFGMGRSIDNAIYGGVAGSSRLYNDLHDQLVPIALQTLVEAVQHEADLAQILRVDTDLLDHMRLAERTLTERHLPDQLVIADPEADRLANNLPAAQSAFAWEAALPSANLEALPEAEYPHAIMER